MLPSKVLIIQDVYIRNVTEMDFQLEYTEIENFWQKKSKFGNEKTETEKKIQKVKTFQKSI